MELLEITWEPFCYKYVKGSFGLYLVLVQMDAGLHAVLLKELYR